MRPVGGINAQDATDILRPKPCRALHLKLIERILLQN